MYRSLRIIVAALASAAAATTIEDLCTVSNVQGALPSNGTLLGIDLIPSSVTTSIVYNSTAEDTDKLFDFCNVTLSYTHTGKGDVVKLNYYFPSPDVFLNRFLVVGGFAYQLNVDFFGGLVYGAATGGTDAGYGALDSTSFSTELLYGNGNINWDATVSTLKPTFKIITYANCFSTCLLTRH
jgi:tannase